MLRNQWLPQTRRAAANVMLDKKGSSHHSHVQSATVLLRTSISLSAKIMGLDRHKLDTSAEQHCQEK